MLYHFFIVCLILLLFYWSLFTASFLSPNAYALLYQVSGGAVPPLSSTAPEIKATFPSRTLELIQVLDRSNDLEWFLSL